MSIEEDEDTGFQTTHFFSNLIVAGVIVFASVRPIIHAFHGHFFIEPDSVGYMSLGDRVWNGQGFSDFSGNWCSDWPPFYPLVFGLVEMLLHGQAIKALGVVGGICLAGTLIVSNALLFKLTRSAALRCGVMIALALSVPLTNIANSGLSETLFIPLSLLSIYFVGQYQERSSLFYFLPAALFALLCCMTRYIGVSVVAALLVSILICPTLTFGKRLLHGALFLMITLTPLTVWCLINKHYSGTMMGQRNPGTSSISDCLNSLWNCLGAAMVQPIFAIILACAAAIGLAIWLLTRRETDSPYLRSAPLFAAIYAFMIVFSSANYNIDMIDDRLTSPLFVPLILTAIGFIEYLRAIMIRPIALVISGVATAFFLLVAAESLTAAQIKTGGYLSPAWQQSPTLSYVSKTAFAYPLYSNDSAATYLIGHKVSSWVADDTHNPGMAYVVAQINGLEGPCYVIWLTNAIEPANFDPKQIVTQCGMQLASTFNDGYIFERTATSSPAAATK